MDKEMKILAFCCNWCSYAAADLAGISRIQYPCSVRIIRVMCSGMVHPDMVLHALDHGADGVLLLGCLLGECHYQDGNYKALARAEIIEEVMADLGYEEERFKIAWLSSAEPDKLAEAVTQMHKSLQDLKPDAS